MGPGVADGRGRARSYRHCVSGAVFDARGGKRDFIRWRGGLCRGGRRARRTRPTVAVLLGWDGVVVGPEAEARGARFGFGGGVGGGGVETLVVPSVASLEHREVDVASVDVDDAEDASVLVAALVSDTDVFAEDEGGEVVFGGGAEGLMGFGSVDSVEADFVLSNGRDARCPSGGREDGECVAVGDASGAAGVRALPPSCGRARTPGAPHGRADVPLPFATDFS